MGQFVRTNGDYTIKVRDGATIKLDVGPDFLGGSVRVTGNLIVDGDMTTVSSESVTIKDNIIVLNEGEVGPGVTLRYSGLQIDRGGPSIATSVFIFDENDDTWILGKVIGDPTTNPIDYQDSKLRLTQISTDPNNGDDGNLTLIGSSSPLGVVHVTGTTDYEDQVTAYGNDAIPNKKYVDDSILNNPTFQIRAPQSQDTRVIIADKEITPNNASTPGSIAYLFDQTTYDTGPDGESAVSVIVDNTLIAQFFTNRLEIGDLELGGGETRAEISTKAGISNQDIYLRTQGTGRIVTDYAYQLTKLGSPPGPRTGKAVVYASEIGTGQTGIGFVNDTDVVRFPIGHPLAGEIKDLGDNQSGELISKRRALLFSMIF